jgi:hypothetical protein
MENVFKVSHSLHGDHQMPLEENKSLIRRWIAWAQREGSRPGLAAMDLLLAGIFVHLLNLGEL